MGTFNEWMAHIYTELGYPKETIDLYLRNTKQENNEKVSTQLHAQRTIKNRNGNHYQLLCLRRSGDN